MNFQAEPLHIGGGKQVFIDWRLIEPGYGNGWGPRDSLSALPYEIPTGVRIAVHPPRLDPTPLIRSEHPWEAFISSYATLLQESGRFRLYYECYADPLALSNYDAMLAVAESDDGESWRKPQVGAVSFNGSKENNLVFGLDASLGRGAHGAGVFTDPAQGRGERFKLVHIGSDASRTVTGRRFIYGAVSPDGMHWRPLPQPLVCDYESDTQNVAAFDSERQRYVLYCRSWRGLHIGRWHGRRCIARAESDCFERFPEPQILVEPDVTFDPDTDLYTNSYHRWPGAADAHLMFPALFHRTDDVLDVHLMTSRDGLHWVRPTREPIVPVGEPGSESEAGAYAGCGIVSFRQGEWSLPIAPHRHTHNQGMHARLAPMTPPKDFFRRAVWREDGFTSLEAPSEGKCTTVPFTFSGGRLQVNAWSRFGGEVRIELADSTNQAHWMKQVRLPEVVPRRGMEDCDPISGDALRRIVTWRGESDVSAWAGKTVRLRFYLRRARLHSIQFI